MKKRRISRELDETLGAIAIAVVPFLFIAGMCIYYLYFGY